jgi:hypothetical protein
MRFTVKRWIPFPSWLHDTPSSAAPALADSTRSRSAVDGASSDRTVPSTDRLPSNAAYRAPGCTDSDGSAARTLNENQPLDGSPIAAKSKTPR